MNDRLAEFCEGNTRTPHVYLSDVLLHWIFYQSEPVRSISSKLNFNVSHLLVPSSSTLAINLLFCLHNIQLQLQPYVCTTIQLQLQRNQGSNEGSKNLMIHN